MKNQLLRYLLSGENPPQELTPEENIVERIFMGGFCAAIFTLPGKTSFSEAEDETVHEITESCAEERYSCLSVCDGGEIRTLISYRTRRDHDMYPALSVAQRIRDALAQAFDVPAEFGVGGFCAFYEMIPFSCREAGANLHSRSASKTIRNILRYVEENYADPELSNGVIAKASFLNYSYMCTQFHGEIGITMNQYIRMFRMRRALRNLEEPGQSIQAAALKAGYDDCKYFSKCFKREFCMTPGRYQRRAADNS